MNKFAEVPEFKLGDDKEYEGEVIRDNAIYAKKADGYLLELYYLVAWKGYLKEENTWKPFLTVMHLRKMINTFHKDYSKKAIVTLAPLNSASPMAKLII